LGHRVKVRILGSEYLVQSKEGGEEVHKIAEFLNGKFKEIEDNLEGLSEKRTAILAAFNIASDYLQLLKEHDDLVRSIEKRTRALIYHIDSVAI
jgi:cell division protein ZapA